MNSERLAETIAAHRIVVTSSGEIQAMRLDLVLAEGIFEHGGHVGLHGRTMALEIAHAAIREICEKVMEEAPNA